MGLQWRPSMIVDNGIIDHDHQVLISIINDFCELKPNIHAIAALHKTLARLYHYANTHFAREEQLQASANFPVRHEHHYAHRKLSQRLDDITEHMRALENEMSEFGSPVSLSEDIAVLPGIIAQHHIDLHNEIGLLLRTWILEHILKDDLAMRPFVDAMKPQAVLMPSIWAAKPASLVPNLDTPGAAKDALASAKTWMHAGFRREKAPLEPPAVTLEKPAAETAKKAAPPPATEMEKAQEHPAIARMRAQALEIGMIVDFDTRCEAFASQEIADAFSTWQSSQKVSQDGGAFTIAPAAMQTFLDATALFQRRQIGGEKYKYRALRAGRKYERIFGEITGDDLEIKAREGLFRRWKLLIDGALEYGAPVHLIGVANAFGRNDLLVEGLLAPFPGSHASAQEVLSVISYEIGMVEMDKTGEDGSLGEVSAA